MASAGSLTLCLHEMYPADFHYISVDKAFRTTEKQSCHLMGGPQCVLCAKCNTWRLTKNVFCPTCNNPYDEKTRLYGGCNNNRCFANNTMYTNWKNGSTMGDPTTAVCTHKRSTPTHGGYAVTKIGEFIGDIIKADQFDLLVSSTRREILDTIKTCDEGNFITPLTSLNGLSNLHAMGEKEATTALNKYLEKVEYPEEQRDPLSFVVEQMNTHPLMDVLPRKGKTVYASVTHRIHRKGEGGYQEDAHQRDHHSRRRSATDKRGRGIGPAFWNHSFSERQPSDTAACSYDGTTSSRNRSPTAKEAHDRANAGQPVPRAGVHQNGGRGEEEREEEIRARPRSYS